METTKQIDRDLAVQALEKRKRGLVPTGREQAALRRIEKERDEDQRWEHYASVPKKHYVEMSGRQPKVLIDQAVRYGLPLKGKTVDLSLVLRAFHDFLAKNARKLAKQEAAAADPWKEERTKLARLQRLEREGVLIRRDQVVEAAYKYGMVLRAAGDRLQRRYGPEAQEILEEAVREFEQEVRKAFGNSPPKRAKR